MSLDGVRGTAYDRVMGRDTELGPPGDGFDPRTFGDIDEFGEPLDWFGDRRLSTEQFAELLRYLEHQGWNFEDSEEGEGVEITDRDPDEIDSLWECCWVHPGGAAFTNLAPHLDDDDDPAWELLEDLCEWAGWIAFDPSQGIIYGVDLRCPQCQGALIDLGEDRCDEGHPIASAEFEVTVRPPAFIRPDTRSELSEGHSAFGGCMLRHPDGRSWSAEVVDGQVNLEIGLKSGEVIQRTRRHRNSAEASQAAEVLLADQLAAGFVSE